jgi:hypothetical protein
MSWVMLGWAVAQVVSDLWSGQTRVIKLVATVVQECGAGMWCRNVVQERS